MIEGNNVFYVSNFNSIGGVETYIYELARKYKDYNPKMEDFLEWHFDGEKLLDKNNNKIC